MKTPPELDRITDAVLGGSILSSVPEGTVSNLKCEICGDGLDNNPDKFALERTNPKGVPGKWRCVDQEACVDRKLKRDFYDSHRPTTAHT